MKAFQIAIKEMCFRWRSSVLMVLSIGTVAGLLSFFWANRTGFEKEIKRNVRDIGSNVVILPADVDQFAYHEQGGYSDVTMPYQVVNQLVEFKASLNHLIPMLEVRHEIQHGNNSKTARIVGIAASISMPGRPKAPMQKAVPENQVQLGSALAAGLGISDSRKQEIIIAEKKMELERINKPTGTWRDSAAFMDLRTVQELFQMPDQISRIEAIECTNEKCAELGVSSNVVLMNEMASITDKAKILRRQKIADARTLLRNMSAKNLSIITNALWICLVTMVVILASWNTIQRRSEIGVFRSIGFSRFRILAILIIRSLLLATVGSVIGIIVGTFFAVSLYDDVFQTTGNKWSIDVPGIFWIAMIGILLSGLAASIPAAWSSSRHPAQIIGKDNA